MFLLRACAMGACLMLIAPVVAARAEAPVALAGHRAVYDLSLLKGTGAKSPAQARGRIAFDFSGSTCDGFIQNFRQITELQPAEGRSKVSDMRSASFEAGDGGDYRFKIETRVDNALVEASDGKAKKAKAGRLEIDLQKPKRGHAELDGNPLFPTDHLRRIIAAARAGETLIEARVYDGTGDGEKAFDTLTLVGKQISVAAPEKPAQADGLKGLARWPVAVSYFEQGKRDGQPVYVLSFDLYENGVSRALRLDYGDFILGGELKELVFSPASACKK